VQRDRTNRSDWRPNAVQDALLTVALAPAGDVRRAWSRCRARIPSDRLDDMEWGTRRLVPLVAWRLREAGVDDPAVEALRADLATSMVATRAKLAAFARVLDAFEEADIDVLVLKGVGIAPLAYPDAGTRPFNDLDVLVRGDQRDRVDELIRTRGAYTSHTSLDDELRVRYRHAASAVIADQDVDVHWRLLVDRYDGTPDADLFARSIAVCVGSATANTLAAEDHIVHAVAHGLRPNRVAPVRWIPDVARLVECCDIDWALVEHEAGCRNLTGAVGWALSFVYERYGVEVPAAARQSLRRAGGRVRPRIELWSRSPKRFRVSGAVNAGVVHYVLATSGWPPRDRVTRYPEYLRFRRAVGDGWGGDEHSGAAHWHG
jgi:hypothetical protein